MTALRGVIDSAYALKGETPIFTADDAYTALTVKDTTKNYVLKRDIDMSEKDFSAEITNYYNHIDGNGYALTGIACGQNYFIRNVYGSFENIKFYVSGNQKDGAYTTSSYELVRNLFNGSSFENVYVSMTSDLSTATKATAYITFANQATETGTTSLENVIVQATYTNAPANVTACRTYLLGHWEKTTVNITNCYVIGGNSGAIIETRYNPKATLTIKNGEDDALISGETGTVQYGGQYAFANMDAFYRSEYIHSFTADMWKDIVKKSADYYTTYFAGYTAISTAEQLATALVSGSRTKYYLANDIDMTGVSLSSNGAQFGGMLDGDGHKVTGIRYTSKAFIGYVEYNAGVGITTSFKNIAFYATKVATTGNTEFGFINVMQSNALENVYIDLTIDASNEAITITGGIFNQTNGGPKIFLNNVVGNLHFVNCENATVGNIGLLYILSGGATQVTMNNAYLAGIEYKENVSASAYLVRLFSSTSNTAEHFYAITNGSDETIKEVKTTVSGYPGPSVLTAKQYCYKDLSAFEQSAYKAYIKGGAHLWYNVFNVWNA